MSVLRQDHFAFDQYTVLDTVMMGNRKLWDVMKEKDAIYEKEDFTEADGSRASELEAEFAEMNGWEAESEVSRLIQGLGMPVESLEALMSTLKESEKVKVMLAQALFGNPDIIMLDEPTNGLDMDAVLSSGERTYSPSAERTTGTSIAAKLFGEALRLTSAYA